MRAVGLTVEEAAEVLGSGPGRVREALLRGEFPGRYLREGAMRLPRQDVEGARETWRARLAMEAQSPTLVSGPPAASPREGLSVDEIRHALLALLREERAAWLEELLAPLDQQSERLVRLEEELRDLRRDVRALTGGGSRSASLVSRSPLDLDGLVREISDLEAMLSDIDASDAV